MDEILERAKRYAEESPIEHDVHILLGKKSIQDTIEVALLEQRAYDVKEFREWLVNHYDMITHEGFHLSTMIMLLEQDLCKVETTK